jgi:polyvinyl alcohol dehydrogenase (cytochrome)
MKKQSADRFLSWMLLVLAGCGGDSPPVGPLAGAGGSTPLAGIGAPVANAGSGAVAPGSAGTPGAMPAGIGGATVPPATAGGSGAPTPTTGGPENVPTVTGMRGSWASFGGDLEHTRSSPGETMLTTANVGMLKPAIDIAAPGVTATPALYNGVIYWADWAGIIHATDLLTQKDVWKVDNSAQMMSGYTGSLFVGERYVYGANRNGMIGAYDRMTGAKVWETMLDAGVHTHIWSSPVVSEQDNVLVVGVGGLGTRDNGVALSQSQLETFHGWVQGLDATTGKELWRFETTPEPNGAGVSVWSSAALDVKRKVAYIGTGNNYYEPVSDYSDSLLAIDYMTGTLKWHEQFTMNDAWTVGTVLSGGVDGDVGATPNLFTLDGKDYVGVGDKPGRYHLHDRETGAQVWSVNLTNGGYQGGVMAPAAYHDGVIYVVSNNDTASSTAFALKASDGATIWEARVTDPTFGGPAYGNGVLYVGDQAGNVWALDAKDGNELWTERLPQGRGGGFSLVDGMLFTGFGFHFSESRREPLTGGLRAWSLTGSVAVPETPTNMPDCVPDTVVTAEPTFTNVYQGVLCAAGCTKVCHSTSMEAGLQLEGKAIAHQSLVSVMAKGMPCATGGHTLVMPGNPEMSLLHGKLALTPACGVGMPPTATAANTPITPAMLTAVRAWIAAGAPNN